jgi:ATP-dependent HslUV protease ATP-binding subunit HslU
MDLTPRQIVAELDKYIVGQAQAKRAVAIALRNRYRRDRLAPELQAEVSPKNILLIGPTGVGKTELARRLARLVGAPFVKVEATKYTEVGYVGRDVESMVRDLVEVAVRMVQAERTEQVQQRAAVAARERLIDLLAPKEEKRSIRSPLEALFGPGEPAAERPQEKADVQEKRSRVAAQLDGGELEQQQIEIEVEDTTPPNAPWGGPGEEMGLHLGEMLGSLLPKRKHRRKVSVAQARKILIAEEARKLIDMDEVVAEAIARAENHGIIFLDEIDKIAGSGRQGPDISREGVQRDILPLVEGSTVSTKHGPVSTQHMLFIAAGAFHVSKPSDLIPELQGRFPIRVELEPLTEDDFARILVEPEHALLKQYQALLAVDGVTLEFTDDAIREIARMAARVNQATENIGARRLHTILERLLEELSFESPGESPQTVVIDGPYVRQRLEGLVQDHDVSRYIL